jgi:hypothetical protein
MPIRAFQPGDEFAQARIYNLAAGSLPAFKPATVEEIVRRHAKADPDPGSRYYAVEDGEIVGYASFAPNGRLSYPWCLPGAEPAREPLLQTVLAAMKERRIPEAWAAYRADWSPVLEFLRGHGFLDKRQMINYVAEVSQLLPDTPLPPDRVIEPVSSEAIGILHELAPVLYSHEDSQGSHQFYTENPFHDFSDDLVALKEAGNGATLGIALLVVEERFADPTQINAAMPCFRFGTFGTERERHKRVNGLFSTVFKDEIDGELLLAWLVRTRARTAGLKHIAAQAPSDSPAPCALYDRFFHRQGAFPILSRRFQD